MTDNKSQVKCFNVVVALAVDESSCDPAVGQWLATNASNHSLTQVEAAVFEVDLNPMNSATNNYNDSY